MAPGYALAHLRADHIPGEIIIVSGLDEGYSPRKTADSIRALLV